MDVSQPTVCDWVNGKIEPTATNLRRLSAITGLSIDELLSPAAPLVPTSRDQKTLSSVG
jgi:transcriptional regulator with XRE-family HTH domain